MNELIMNEQATILDVELTVNKTNGKIALFRYTQIVYAVSTPFSIVTRLARYLALKGPVFKTDTPTPYHNLSLSHGSGKIYNNMVMTILCKHNQFSINTLKT